MCDHFVLPRSLDGSSVQMLLHAASLTHWFMQMWLLSLDTCVHHMTRDTFHQECGSCCQLPFGNQSNNVFWKCAFYHTMVYPLLQVVVYFLSWQIVYKFSRMIILWEGSREGFTDEETSKFDFERWGAFRDNRAGYRMAKPTEHCKQPRHSCLSEFNDSPWITGHLWTGHSVLHAWVWFICWCSLVPGLRQISPQMTWTINGKEMTL